MLTSARFLAPINILLWAFFLFGDFLLKSEQNVAFNNNVAIIFAQIILVWCVYFYEKVLMAAAAIGHYF